MVKLSKRLEAIHALIPKNARLADVGTDHGLLILKALEMETCTYAYALDIAEQPLNAARKNVTQYGYEAQVSFQLRNGLNGFEDEANCYVVAGMGAETIWSIIASYAFKTTDTIILQSNTKNPWLRTQLNLNGFHIDHEVFLFDRNIPCFILVVSKQETLTKLTEMETLVGPVLLTSINDEYRAYLTSRKEHLATIQHHDNALSRELKLLSEIV